MLKAREISLEGSRGAQLNPIKDRFYRQSAESQMPKNKIDKTRRHVKLPRPWYANTPLLKVKIMTSDEYEILY